MLTHKGTQTIETSRLILRKAVREDAVAMFRNWASDPEVTKPIKAWKPQRAYWMCGSATMKETISTSG